MNAPTPAHVLAPTVAQRDVPAELLEAAAARAAAGAGEVALPAGPLHLLIDSTGLKLFGAGEWLQKKQWN